MKLSRLLVLSLGLTSAFAAEETTAETTIYWTAGVGMNYGWNDINKTLLDDGEFAAMEDSMCYAAAAANIIAWWQAGGWQDEPNAFLPSPDAPNTLDSIWAQYVGNNANPDEGGEPLSAMNWWISGIYEPLDKNNCWAEKDDELWERYYQSYDSVIDDSDGTTEPGSLTLTPSNGYYYDQYGLTQSDLSALLEEVWVESDEPGAVDCTTVDFKALLESGAALTLGVCDDGDEVAHALTLWGVEYDEEGNLYKLWLTDSDDTDETNGEETILGIKVEIRNGKLYMDDYSENVYIAGVYAFNAPVTSEWQLVPEPTTATLSLLALAALAARRRRK